MAEGDIVRIAFPKLYERAPIAVLSNANVNTATRTADMFCNSYNPSAVTIGGSLTEKGVYVFNVHVGR